ncbi:MAG: acetyl-CoA carboxylase biotin carboxyl carrier protein [Bryobacterales bacterium]|nr:acetyl-CoA carboxylase biotin carboxyl carrier protein [Bryobacterales bacterium]
MTIEEIKQLIDLANETGVAELEVERQGNRVWIRRAAVATQHEVVLPPYNASTTASSPQPSASSPAGPASGADPSIALVKAPIVGTFYESPSPGSPAFVKPGDTVQVGQVLCIIESMKLMNEIEAETSGVIVARLVENGRPVEYGEALFSIRPL